MGATKLRGHCSWCLRDTALKADGTIGPHKSHNVLMGRVDCPGVGKAPAKEG